MRLEVNGADQNHRQAYHPQHPQHPDQWKRAKPSLDDLMGGDQSEKATGVTSPSSQHLPRPDETIEIFHFDRASTE